MPDPFVTVQDLSDLLGRDVSADDGAVIALDWACDMCRTMADHPFNRGTVTESFDGTGTDSLILPYLPVNSAGTVTVDGGTITDYTLTGHGLLLRGAAGGLPRPVWPAGRQNVTVTYDRGYEVADVPRDVRGVALAYAKRIVVQGEAVRETQGDQSIQYALAATELTKNEERILKRRNRNRSF